MVFRRIFVIQKLGLCGPPIVATSSGQLHAAAPGGHNNARLSGRKQAALEPMDVRESVGYTHVQVVHVPMIVFIGTRSWRYMPSLRLVKNLSESKYKQNVQI